MLSECWHTQLWHRLCILATVLLQSLWGANVMENMHCGMATMGPDASTLCPPGRLFPIRGDHSYSPQDSREVWLRFRGASATPRPSDAGAAEDDDTKWNRIEYWCVSQFTKGPWCLWPVARKLATFESTDLFTWFNGVFQGSSRS